MEAGKLNLGLAARPDPAASCRKLQPVFMGVVLVSGTGESPSPSAFLSHSGLMGKKERGLAGWKDAPRVAHSPWELSPFDVRVLLGNKPG